VLEPLGRFPQAASTIVRSESGSDEFKRRKVAAALAGWIKVPAASLLDDLFRNEALRDQGCPPGDLRRLEAQSVVEDIVFAATRWARDPALRPAGLALLRTIVQRTIAGEYWNTASYALTTLCRYSDPEAAELLRRFRAFAAGPAPAHPSKPSLTQERSFADNLLAGNPRTMLAIEGVLDGKDEAASAKLDSQAAAAIDALCEAARQFDRENTA
jgi:hypothetical protein